MTFRSGNTPLGLFTSKNFATTISPWVVTAMALEPYDCVMVEQGRDDVSGDPVPLEYLRDPNYGES
jgi:fumarylacetoacetase